MVGWLVPEPGFWVAKVRRVSEVAGRFGAFRDLKGWSIATFWQHWKVLEDRQVPRYTKASYGFVWFSKNKGGAGRPQNSYLSG